MSNETMQPLESIGPIDGGEQQGLNVAPQELTQAQKDYKEGRDHLKNDDLPQAAMCFHNALKGFEQDGDQVGVANASDRLGDVCLAREEYENALAHFERAHAICKKEDDPFSMMALNKKRAVAYKKLGRFDEALEVLFTLFDHYAETRNPQGSVQILEVIAEVYVLQGEKEKAADAFTTIASIHSNFGHETEAGQFREKAEQVVK
jgi:tetratricopeptide (TPR) repeat protein